MRGKNNNLGCFDNELDGAKVYDDAVRRLSEGGSLGPNAPNASKAKPTILLETDMGSCARGGIGSNPWVTRHWWRVKAKSSDLYTTTKQL